MTDYLTFEGRIEPMDWGDSTYTVLPLPDHVTAVLAEQGARRVEGEINDHSVNLALTKAPVIDKTFLWTGKTLLRDCQIEPGEIVEVRLRKADPRAVEVPSDVLAAIRSAGESEAWEALTPGKQRGLLHQINTAKRADTRTKRIIALIAELSS